ncbi:MAG: amidase, partial [Methylobacteriaceae bacterium]|nr:amidase [Methylobacteriaceae bacterium]
MAHATEDLVTTYAQRDGLGLSELVRSGEVAPAELVEAAVLVIERLNPQLNAVVHRLYDIGRAGASSIDRKAPFAGVPFLLKELGSMWKGAPLTNSCAWMKNVVASSDSEVVKRIRAAGFLLVGKANSPENGWSITTEPKLYGPTHNPWRRDVTSGGSSGGSAAAVAARMVPLAEATDAAGSIRVPASCCGTVGLKPSRGRITPSPRGDVWHGCAYFGCVSRTVRDTAAYLDATAGTLAGDPYSAPVPDASWLSLCAQAPRRLRIGFTVKPPDGHPIHPEAETAVRNTVRTLERLGHDLESHDMPLDAPHAWQVYTRMSCVQAAALFESLAPLVGAPVTANDVEPVTWAIIERGRSLSGVQHFADVEAVRLLSRAIASDLAPYDVFITPTLTQPPRPLGYLDMSEPDLDRYNAKWTDGV